MSPLGETIRSMIETEGPLPFDQFMQLALGHPQHGYYMSRDPFGARGDFVTSPEISQMFGELLGLWAAETWARIGCPSSLRLVELGPGRGTLMADALRACQVAPEFMKSLAEVCLVETSAVLRKIQEDKLADYDGPLGWYDSLDQVPPGPTIFIANEFFDALPVRQFIRVEEGWCEKLVGVNEDGTFFFGLSPEPDPLIHAPAPVGYVLEIGAAGHQFAASLAARIADHGGAAIIVDYGHTQTTYGETVQAMRNHRAVDPLSDPGECDITAHVDFASLARAANATGARVFGPITQADFLNRLGIVQRAEALKRNASPLQGIKISRELTRLTSTAEERGASGATVPGMGALFKALAIIEPNAEAPPGFEPRER